MSKEDQASSLRHLLTKRQPENLCSRVIAVASGKGGVGKTNFCVNFSLSLAKRGLRPLLVDADVGFTNVEVLLNVQPTATLIDLGLGAPLRDVLQSTPYGISFLTAGDGIDGLLSFQDAEKDVFFKALGSLSCEYDVTLIDLGAGISPSSLAAASAADEMILVSTPEPTSLADAYALIKALHQHGVDCQVRVVMNRVRSIAEGREAIRKLQLVTSRFLNVNVDLLGFILEDAHVVQAVMNQTPYVHSMPYSRASACIQQITENFLTGKSTLVKSGFRGFLERVIYRGKGGVPDRPDFSVSPS